MKGLFLVRGLFVEVKGGNRGCKHILELEYSKHSIWKKCGQPNIMLHPLTVICKTNPALISLKYCLTPATELCASLMDNGTTSGGLGLWHCHGIQHYLLLPGYLSGFCWFFVK